MADPVLVNCTLGDPINPEEKFRVTFTQSTLQAVENVVNPFTGFGGTMRSVYTYLTTSPWCYVVSEPPLDDANVYVVDLRIQQGTVGASPPGTVADLVNSLENLMFANPYDVQRVELLPTDAPILEQRSVVQDQAKTDLAKAGLPGFVSSITEAFGGLKGVVIAVAVIAGAITVIWLAKESRALGKAT